MADWLGIDIGGANIKLAMANGYARSEVYPLWKFPDQLGAEIGRLLEEAPGFDGIALTMTGELADCYATREEGVCRILEQLTSVFPANLVRVYSVGGQWLTPSAAARVPWDVAASNWHALAAMALRWTESRAGLLIDIGSTTTDIIPFAKNKLQTPAKTDSDRLLHGQLVYTGVRRTPVCAVTRTLPLRGHECPVMAELFATMDDAFLIVGDVAEDPNDQETADGRPRTVACAKARMARMVGEDASTLCHWELEMMAKYAIEQQAEQIGLAIRKNLSAQKPKAELAILSGHADFIASRALAHAQWSPKILKLSEMLGESVARCAPAYGVAMLAVELQLPDGLETISQ
jgi:(4-(4-[2-(gamma-L-glutamylamino)ethyl]phenoxymethyl)furan-2-yl)methanamine synthase